MNLTGEITVDAPREAVFDAIQDAKFFASCVDGVQELREIDPNTYDAVFETKIAYIKFRFKMAITITRKDRPNEIEATAEGTPMGIVGRVTATSRTRLTQDGNQTRISYAIDTALTGRLGSLGQPVLRAKAREMERQFTTRLRARFQQASSEVAL
jgi:carbon monoxide dehydrogenase subunit G